MPLCLVPCACCASPARPDIFIQLGFRPKQWLCSAACGGCIIRQTTVTTDRRRLRLEPGQPWLPRWLNLAKPRQPLWWL